MLGKCEHLSRVAVDSSAAPGEKGRRTEGLVEIHVPRPPTAEATPQDSFSQLRVPFILPVNLSNVGDFPVLELSSTVILRETFHHFEIWHRILYVSMLYRFIHHHSLSWFQIEQYG